MFAATDGKIDTGQIPDRIEALLEYITFKQKDSLPTMLLDDLEKAPEHPGWEQWRPELESVELMVANNMPDSVVWWCPECATHNVDLPLLTVGLVCSGCFGGFDWHDAYLDQANARELNRLWEVRHS